MRALLGQEQGKFASARARQPIIIGGGPGTQPVTRKPEALAAALMPSGYQCYSPDNIQLEAPREGPRCRLPPPFSGRRSPIQSGSLTSFIHRLLTKARLTPIVLLAQAHSLLRLQPERSPICARLLRQVSLSARLPPAVVGVPYLTHPTESSSRTESVAGHKPLVLFGPSSSAG